MRSPRRPGMPQALALRVYGVVFLVIVALLLGLSVAVYRKTFVDVVPVTLETERVGLQLSPRADVKLRGLVVGEVRSVDTDGERARIELALKPDYVDLVPSNVSARLLPKTLFGEKYVDLVPPATPARPLRAGDVIPQDRSTVAIEIEQVLDGLLPLLRTVQPEKLNATLSAFADALEGRGDRLGENLALVNRYFTGLNPELETLERDISGLADVADVYTAAAPGLVATLRNFSVTTRTVAEKQSAYAGFLAGTAGFARSSTGLFRESGDRMIRLAATSRPTLQLLARYAPSYPCLLQGLNESNEMVGRAFDGEELHITLEVVRPRPAYKPGEYPAWRDDSAPSCFGLPNPAVPDRGHRFDDGSAGPTPGAAAPRAVPAALVDPDAGWAGTAAEQRVVAGLLAPVMGVPADDVPAVATLLLGPVARGTTVRQSPAPGAGQ